MNKLDLFTLSLIDGIGDKTLLNILNRNISINQILSYDSSELEKIIKGSRKYKAIDILLNHYDSIQDQADILINDFQNQNILLVSFVCDKYPLLYKRLHNPPIFLYVKGNLDLLNHRKSIAIVGSRECSPIGLKITSSISKYFVSKGYNIVSGLATGIDTAAHLATIEEEGLTTAVIPDVYNIVPKENIHLANRILENKGLLISENKPGTRLHKGLFINRDRLQSGLSIGVFPIETKFDGGTIHTINFAKEQSRLLCCPKLDKIKNYPLDYEGAQPILDLIRNKEAVGFTKDNYAQLLKSLEDKESVLWDQNNNNQKTLF